MKKKIHLVAGPTASGKTDFAVELAKKINGELINVDSRQINKYLDIGTNKGNEDIHLVSFLEPDKPFNAFSFRELVYEKIEDIWSRGKTPVLVGGTGLYIDVILHPEKYAEEGITSADNELRKKLEELSVEELQNRLKNISSSLLETMNNSDKNNPRRLIRAIEKASQNINTKKLPLELSEELKQALPDVKIHYISLPMDELTEKINERVVRMWEDGIVDEVKKVLKMGYPSGSIALQGIGYREVLRFISGEIDEKECIRLIQIAHRQYAKRQMTWFGKYLEK